MSFFHRGVTKVMEKIIICITFWRMLFIKEIDFSSALHLVNTNDFIDSFILDNEAAFLNLGRIITFIDERCNSHLLHVN